MLDVPSRHSKNYNFSTAFDKIFLRYIVLKLGPLTNDCHDNQLFEHSIPMGPCNIRTRSRLLLYFLRWPFPVSPLHLTSLLYLISLWGAARWSALTHFDMLAIDTLFIFIITLLLNYLFFFFHQSCIGKRMTSIINNETNITGQYVPFSSNTNVFENFTFRKAPKDETGSRKNTRLTG